MIEEERESEKRKKWEEQGARPRAKFAAGE